MKLSKIFEGMVNDRINHKKSYIGQCNYLRRDNPVNEAYWQEMIKNQQLIPVEEFINGVDMGPLLDEEERPEDYLREALMTDPDTNTYKSNWGKKECMFFQSAGFEFIFV